jgi:hypothetical protein
MINNNIFKQDITFINPHQMSLNNKIILYTNVENNNIKVNKKNIYELFEELRLNKTIEDSRAFINHYSVQSKEDYMKRKVNRNRDDINVKRKFNDNMLIINNEKKYNNLINYYNDIKKLLYNDIDLCFIILRYVIDERTNTLWQNCYDCIRNFYNNKIIIIDDHSNDKYLTKDKILINCEIIKSEFKGRGELLPYYYYLKNRFSNRIVVLHDSMFIKEKIDFIKIKNYNNFTRLFSFHSNAYNMDIQYFKDYCNCINKGNIIYDYHLKNKNHLIGCFGVCYIIDYDFLYKIENKYKITNLINIIDTRDKRKTLERFFSCLFEYESNSTKCPDLMGSIFITLKHIKNKQKVPIEKYFSGR